MAPKVSVIIPVYNVEEYLAECLDSALSQTLADLEVICVNDGSTDGSLQILQEYAAKDSRIKIINKPNAGYGAAMNDGIKAAQGEYIAFLESDDSIEPNAYERLAQIADKENLDIIKGDYFELTGEGGERTLKPISVVSNKGLYKGEYNEVVNPLKATWPFYVPMMNCLGLMRRSFLEANDIHHNETPGAAHQDMGFWFQTFVYATRLMYINEPFYRYRQDNPNSSMKSDTHAFITLREYGFINEVLKRRPALRDKALPILFHRKFTSCMYQYGKSAERIKISFLEALGQEYLQDFINGEFRFQEFRPREVDALRLIIADPEAYYFKSHKERVGATTKELELRNKEIIKLRYLLDRSKRENKKGSVVLSPEVPTDAPSLSFVIPVYNSAAYLSECLDSILAQTDGDFEIICVNDGSTDNSMDVLEEYAEKDFRVKVFSQENAGQSAARNLGVAQATGRYIWFVDSDDAIHPEAAEVLLKKAIAEDLDMLFFDAETIFDSEELAKRHKSFKTAYKRSFGHPTPTSGVELFTIMSDRGRYRVSPCMFVIKREYLAKTGITFSEGKIYEDNSYTAECILMADRAAHINEPYYIRRMREGSTMTSSTTYYDLLSYFQVYMEMLDFAVTHSFPEKTEKEYVRQLAAMLRSCRAKYKKCSETDRKMMDTLPPIDHFFYELLISDPVGAVEKMKRKKGRGGTASSEYIYLAAAKKNSDAERKLKAMRASTSWKIGRAITALPRWVKRKFKGSKKAAKKSSQKSTSKKTSTKN